MDNTFGKNIIPDNDELRIEALKRYKILDTPPESAFDNVAKLATQIFDVPVSLISLVDAEQVYFKANVGMGDVKSTSRGVSLCSLSILDKKVTVFENAPKEPCLLTNPNVAGSFGLRFYAGAPLTTTDGFRIGTLCIIDKSPRTFDEKSRVILESLAKIVMDELELRLSSIEEAEKQHTISESAEAVNEELKATNDELFFSQRMVEELNEELSTTNEEITTANDELISLNHSLKDSQRSLYLSNAKLAESEEIKNLAIEQAELGIWYIDADTREFVSSPRLKEFFGYEPSETMAYDTALTHIREDYRSIVGAKVEEAIASGEAYDLEYPIISKKDSRLRWVRATGKLNPADNGRRSYFSGTIMDITERKEDDQRKNGFISIVSHELKTPLTSMSGYIQVLQLKAAKNGDDFSSGVLGRALLQVRKMGSLIDGFLNMKRAETGKIPLNTTVFDMAELVKEAEVESQATISSHNVIFAPVERTIVNADRDKIGQVITNFINNAVKYSPRGTTINVACVTKGTNAVVSVKDQGIGIAEHDLKKLFERFYRVDRKEIQTISGFGIGLYLCDEIIQAHAGKIWVESELGKGSTFFFSIPTESSITKPEES